MSAKKLKWKRVSKRLVTPHGHAFWRSAHLSACGRFEVVAVTRGPLGSTWHAFDLETGESRQELDGNLKPCKAWCEGRAVRRCA